MNRTELKVKAEGMGLTVEDGMTKAQIQAAIDAKAAADGGADQSNDRPADAKGPKLVKMLRESDGKTAEVHPDEVENYKLGDYKQVN